MDGRDNSILIAAYIEDNELAHLVRMGIGFANLRERLLFRVFRLAMPR